jgi:hypothetical protein
MILSALSMSFILSSVSKILKFLVIFSFYIRLVIALVNKVSCKYVDLIGIIFLY